MKQFYIFSIAALIGVASLQPVFSQNNALNFDGLNDYIELNAVSALLAGSSNFTVEFWIKTDRLNQPSSVPVVSLFAINTNTPIGSDGLIIQMGSQSSQTGYLSTSDDGGVHDFVSTTNIGDNNCHHIAYVRDGNVGYLYVDGISVGNHSTTYLIKSTDRVSIAQDWDDLTSSPVTSQFMKGDFDDFRIWSTSRTSTEIASNMNSELIGTEPNLLVYYKFNQGIAGGNNIGVNIAPDNSSNSYDGNLTNFALNGNTSNWSQNSCTITSIEKITIEDVLVIIYPNPSSHLLTIESELVLTEINIIDITGKKIKTVKQNQKSINIADLPTGIYFIQFTSEAEGIITQKFIKQ